MKNIKDITDNLREISARYASLIGRWRDARPYSQEVASLHATFKMYDSQAGEVFASGAVGNLLDEIEYLWAELAERDKLLCRIARNPENVAFNTMLRDDLIRKVAAIDAAAMAPKEQT